MKINQQMSINFNSRIGSFKTKKFAKRLHYVREEAATVLNRDYSEILLLTKGANEKRINFFQDLVETYNANNFYHKEDNISVIDLLYKNIKLPKNVHSEIIKTLKTSMQNLNDIFGKTGEDIKSLNFVKNVSVLLKDNKQNDKSDLILDLLNSKNKDFYVNNFDKIKSYLALNINDENVVKNLDNLINNNGYDYKIYDKKLEISNIFRNITEVQSDNFNVNGLVLNYSKPRSNFFRILQQCFYHSSTQLSSEVGEQINKMYDTTNNKNINIRNQVMKYFSSPYTRYKNFGEDVKFFSELNKLFTSLDSGDKHLKSFMNKLTKKNNQYFENPTEINNLIENVSTKKLDIFYKNFEKIMHYVPIDSREAALKKGIEKPYIGLNRFKKNNKDAIKYKFVKTPGYVKVVLANLENIFNKLRYNLIPDIKSGQKLTLIKSENVIEDFDKNKNLLKEFIEVDVAKPIEEENFVQVSNRIIDNIKQEEIKTDDVIKISKKLDKKLKKELLVNDILGFAKQKLGVKTFENQRESFVENATKMRYEMLPEIFASIMDTRKADKAVGKHRINSSNKDALRLYTMINGNNKKFVNYLLKKRNVDGSRMFEVKEIITTLENAEQQTQKQKQNNPEYRAKDIRKYYNHLLEAKIQQYGKVTKNRVSKTK